MALLSTQELAKLLYDATLSNKGATMNSIGESPTDGYMVGGYVPTQTVPVAQFVVDDIAAFIEQHASMLDSGDEFYVGTWVSAGLVYLDLSKRFRFLSDALIIGGLHKELAVWSVSAGQEITL